MGGARLYVPLSCVIRGKVAHRVFRECADVIVLRAVEELGKCSLANYAVEVVWAVCAGVVDDVITFCDVDSVVGVESSIDAQHIAVLWLRPAVMM